MKKLIVLTFILFTTKKERDLRSIFKKMKCALFLGLLVIMMINPRFSNAYCTDPRPLEDEFDSSDQVVLVKTIRKKHGILREDGFYKIIAEYKVLKTYKGEHIEKIESPTGTEYGPIKDGYTPMKLTSDSYPFSGEENSIHVFFVRKIQRINNDGTLGDKEMNINPCYQISFIVKELNVFEHVETFEDFINMISKEPEYKEKFEKVLIELKKLSKATGD